MRESTEFNRIRDLLRVVHDKNMICFAKQKGSAVTTNEYLVSCHWCLKNNGKKFNKALFLKLLSESEIIKDGEMSIIKKKAGWV